MLMKVGLYAGIFLTTPVILWQIWGFVSPGLYPRSASSPRPSCSSARVAFMVGRAVLLLRAAAHDVPVPPAARGTRRRWRSGWTLAQAREDEALRFLRLGELERAGDLRASAPAQELRGRRRRPGRAAAEAPLPERRSSSAPGSTALGRLIDAARDGLGPRPRAGAAPGDGEAAGGGRGLRQAATAIAAASSLDAGGEPARGRAAAPRAARARRALEAGAGSWRSGKARLRRRRAGPGRMLDDERAAHAGAGARARAWASSSSCRW